MTTKIARIAVVFVALVLVRLDAYAESRRPWSLNVSVGEIYDDNRDSSDTDKTGQFTTYVEPRIAVNKITERLQAEAYYMPSLRFRTKPRWNQNDSDLYHDLGVNLGYQATRRLRLLADEYFNYTDDPAVMYDGQTFREDATYTLNRIQIGGAYQVFPDDRLLATLIGSHEMKDYQKELFADIGNETRLGAQGELKYVLKSGYNVLCGLQLASIDLGTQYEGVNRDSTLLNVTAGLEKRFAQWTVRGRVGLDTASLDNAEKDTIASPAGDLQLVLTPTAKSTVDLTLQRRLIRGDISPYATQERTSVAVGARHKIRERIEVGLRALYARGDYKADTVALDASGKSVDPALLDGHDALTSVGVTGSYRVNRSVKLHGSYDFQDWDASSFLRDPYQRNMVKLAATADF